jgi:hypothetical protein
MEGTMHTSAPIIFFLILAVSLTGCGDEKIESTWTESPITLDGDGFEWPASQLLYVEDIRGVIGASNSDSVLSVMFRFRDDGTARKAMMGGVTVWWSRHGEKSKDIGVRYAGKFNIDEMRAELPSPEEMGDRGDMGGRGRRMSPPEPREGPLHDQILLVEQDVEVPLVGAGAAAAYFNGFYTYEVSIPLGWSELQPQALDAGPGDEIRLCVELGGLSKSDREQLEEAMKERMRGPGGAGPGGGMGPEGGMGPPGGGTGGRGGMGGPPGGRGDMGAMFEKEEMWFTISLADGPEEGNQPSF